MSGRLPLLSLTLFLVACVFCEGGEPEPPVASTLEVTAMSFNIRWDGFDDGADAWEHRRDFACDVIRRVDPDVLGLQESSRPASCATNGSGAIPRITSP